MSALPKHIRVLLIEDDPDDVFILRKLLQKASTAQFELAWAGDLSSGMQKAKSGELDVVLLDLTLPDSTGLKTFYEMRQAVPEIPIIVLSGLNDDEVALEAVHAGAQDYLVKGQGEDHLLTRSLIYAIERTQAKAAVTLAEEKYRNIFENAVEGIFQTTPDGHYLAVNPALTRIYGYTTPQELIAQLTDIGHQLYVDSNRRDEFVRIMQEKGVVTEFESEIYRRDRSIIWISESARAVKSTQGKILYFEGMVEDITQRKHSEERMRSSEKRFRSIWASAIEGMRLTDAMGIVVAVNPAYCNIVGLSEEELVGKPFTIIYSQNEDDLKEMMAKYKARFSALQIQGQLVRQVTFKSGKTVHLESFNSYVEMEKNTLVLAVFHDITARKQAEAQLAASQAELQKKNEMMEDDLRMAYEVQQAILPQRYPTFPRTASPEQSRLRFCHRYQTSGTVGGDFLNVRALSDTKAGLFICDVMGHGVRSALVTTMIRGLVEELSPIAHDPAQLLERINHDLCAILQQTDTPLFTTAFYAVADLEARLLQFSNAGHPQPFLIHRGTGQMEILKSASVKRQPALGLFQGSHYQNSTVAFGPDDMIFACTDGLYEAEGADGSFYSKEMLSEAVGRHAVMSAPDLLDQLLREITDFAGGKKFADDVCLVAMEAADAAIWGLGKS